MRDDAGAHRVVEVQLAVGEAVAEVDVHRARQVIGDGGQAQVVRGHEADRPGRDQRPHDALGPGDAVGGVGPGEEFVEQKQRAAARRPFARSSNCRTLVTSAKNRDRPAWSESCTRIVAPSETGVSVSDRARTTPPASASTTFTPTERSSVLLPDMFDPLTISTRGPVAADLTSLATHRVGAG